MPETPYWGFLSQVRVNAPSCSADGVPVGLRFIGWYEFNGRTPYGDSHMDECPDIVVLSHLYVQGEGFACFGLAPDFIPSGFVNLYGCLAIVPGTVNHIRPQVDIVRGLYEIACVLQK